MITPEKYHQITKEIFGFLIERGFEFIESNNDIVIARRGDVELLLRFEQFQYLSPEIRLSGEIGQLATPEEKYRHLGTTAIIRCLNPNFNKVVGKIQDEAALATALSKHAAWITEYCMEILLGDISQWPAIVECLNEKRKKRGLSSR